MSLNNRNIYIRKRNYSTLIIKIKLYYFLSAAVKLRKLAAEGNNALRALGILSVQLEGDTVLSLRLVGQEIVLRTGSNYLNIKMFLYKLILIYF